MTEIFSKNIFACRKIFGKLPIWKTGRILAQLLPWLPQAWKANNSLVPLKTKIWPTPEISNLAIYLELYNTHGEFHWIGVAKGDVFTEGSLDSQWGALITRVGNAFSCVMGDAAR